uniref:FecR family protein n=1 Tax=Pedobacter schmidteae TaxID=2201271 RepID=UPI000EAB6F03|nr:FecR domain-containing protein [Pedobacter schmidteae]
MKKNKIKEEESKLEQSIANYFEKKAQDEHPEHSYTHDFDKEKVYSNVLDLIERRQKKWSLNKIQAIAAAILLLLSATLSFYYYKSQTPDASSSLVMMQESAPKGKVIKLSLEDGTIVFLNAGSTLSFPKSFTAKTREVVLKGEGFFKVAHDIKKPFIIHTDKVNTQVLGTSFNINAYAEHKDIKVTVVSGKVAVYTQADASGKATRLITANQQVVYNKASQRLDEVEEMVNAANLVAWSEGKMIYNNQLLSDVIMDVERHYNIDIEAAVNLQSCRVTANFDNASVEKVLKVLSKLIDGDTKYKNGIYFLNGKGC